jgi:hypothetical protein
MSHFIGTGRVAKRIGWGSQDGGKNPIPPIRAYSQKYNVRLLYLTFLVWLSIKNRSDHMLAIAKGEANCGKERLAPAARVQRDGLFTYVSNIFR